MAIRLYREGDRGYTSVSNDFIDHYMPSANGEFVKLYLYLLRCLSAGQDALSVSTLADRFSNTEKDIAGHCATGRRKGFCPSRPMTAALPAASA